MFDKYGNKVSRGTRVFVEFPEAGIRWTGRVVGSSGVDPSRTRIRSEYVRWKGPLHVQAANFTRLADQAAPIHYSDSAQTINRPFGR